MAKRGNGAGSVYRRKSDGKWVGSITLEDGKRKVFYGKTQKEVQDKVTFYSKKLNEGLSPKSINNIHGLLHKALSNAVRWNILPRNVCDVVTPPRLRRKEKAVLTPEQARTLLQAIKNHHMEALLTLALVTGMRCGELLALRWQDIDLANCSLQVKRTVSYVKGYGRVESEPKTEKSRRQIMHPLLVVEVLIRHKSLQGEQRGKTEAWANKDLVFTNAEGDYMGVTTMRDAFNRVLKDAGLPHIRFHDLRHSAATILLSRGTHPKVVQEILGHSQISMTLDVYSHVLPSMQEDVTKRWDDDFGASVPVPV